MFLHVFNLHVFFLFCRFYKRAIRLNT